MTRKHSTLAPPSGVTAKGLDRRSFEDRRDAEAFLSGLADCVSEVRFSGDPADFEMNYAGGTVGRSQLHFGVYSPVAYRATRADELHVVVPRRGTVRFAADGLAIEAVAGRSIMLLPPTHQGRGEAVDGGSALSYITTAGEIQDHAEKLIGDHARIDWANSPVEVASMSEPIADSLGRNIASVFGELMALDRHGLSSIASANFDQLLLGLACAVTLPQVRARLVSVAPGSASHARKARDHIRANASEPVVLTELAASLGIGLRALQIAFRREYGQTLRDYLVECRLQIARQRLLAAGHRDTVAAIAFDCGFTDLSAFARHYRKSFGELPSTSIRRR